MRSPLKATLLLLLASPLGLQAGDTKLGTCESAVGPWEFIVQPGGRGLMTKEGAKYHVMWVARVANATAGTTEAEGTAAECTCQAAAQKLVWKCRVSFSLRPSEIGTEQTYEWGVDGDTLKSWYVGPDGKRSDGVGIRRPK